ncbi:glycosyltransferase family 2 protein [Halogeometricum sp. S1BR25-6]|uniref:Glycosyltransferase family 2 protein n=1 Tax=Halogeometricum salsisoli TaxID=2950536 RepID=A0ABU2GHI5_9EURY|nr:glycosyltransferase family 2 protein [Halogeometricum sp. S1BR25-6]MDS0300273.1 glycosyltransferase family 2 protein [Halogeometricum sp. S1BR25-6]
MESNARVEAEVEVLNRENPAIGVVATADNEDAIARILLRANRRGYSVLVSYRKGTESRAVELAREASAVVVPAPNTEFTEGLDEYHLTEAARELGFPGIVLHEDCEEYVDYDAIQQSERTNGEEFYAIESQSHSLERQQCEVLASIPAYNEGSRIGDVVTEAGRYADMTLVVDDGSTDDTAAIARRAGAVVVEHEQNRGYGGALQTIFKEAERRGADHLIILDGDGQHDAADIPKLVERQRQTGAELVVGDRFGEGAESEVPLYRRFGLTIVNVLTNLSMGVVRSRAWVRDTQNGFRAYDETAIKSLANDDGLGEHMSASTDILHHAHHRDYDIEEVGTTVRYDIENASTHNPIKHGAVLVSNIIRTVERERPLSVLGIPGFGIAFLGISLGYWTVSKYLQTSDFPLELATVASFSTLAGLFICFTAIILHSLKTHYP